MLYFLNLFTANSQIFYKVYFWKQEYNKNQPRYGFVDVFEHVFLETGFEKKF